MEKSTVGMINRRIPATRCIERCQLWGFLISEPWKAGGTHAGGGFLTSVYSGIYTVPYTQVSHFFLKNLTEIIGIQRSFIDIPNGALYTVYALTEESLTHS